jgi:hypothetical protein
MKKTKITLIIGWLIFFSASLFAQNHEGIFKLKEGDWFEIVVERSYISPQLSHIMGPVQTQIVEETSLLNYRLQKQLPSGNQLYNICLEHLKGTRKSGKYFLGYDSYYPEFEENKTSPEFKNQYNLEVKPNGEIVYFKCNKSNKSKVVYTSVNSSYARNNSVSYAEAGSDSLIVKAFSDVFMKPDSSIIGIATDVNSRIPYLIKQPGSKLYLTNASFPLPDNAIIQGKVPDQNNRGIRIRPYNGSQMDFTMMKNIKTDKDGTFTCPLFLTRPQHVQIEIDYQTFYSFMEPGDTLNISGIERQVKPARYSEYPKSKKAELIASEKKMSGHFSGNAAYNTMLSTEIKQYRHGFPPGNDILIVMKYYKERMIGINELLDFYAGKASNTCIDYFRRDCNYSLANEKLRFYNEIKYDVKASDKNLLELNRTRDFFLDIDTLSLLMNPFDWNSSYQEFIRMSQIYKQKRLGWAVGKSSSDKFPENFYFVKVSLRGYPMYSQMAEILDRELRSGSADRQIVTSNYLGFINNCNDPALTEPLKKTFKTATQLQIGNHFPVDSFRLQDSSVISLEKFKGKPICLVLLEGPKGNINFYKDIIDRFSSDDMQFIFAKTPIQYLNEGNIDSTILKKQKVTYVNLLDLSLRQKLLFYQTKIFLLYKLFSIVENNA